MTEVVAQDDTVTFEENHASFQLLPTSPNNAFMRRRLYSKQVIPASYRLKMTCYVVSSYGMISFFFFFFFFWGGGWGWVGAGDPTVW